MLLLVFLSLVVSPTRAGKVVMNMDGSSNTDGKPQMLTDFENNEDRIFVAIAALLDPELVPTVRDMLDNAEWPDRLDFGILLQDNMTDPQEFPWEGEERFNVNRVSYLDSNGVGWARHTGAKMYGGQRFYLQLDSHHRFAKNWDRAMIEGIGKCMELGSEKPILSTYVGGYSPSASKHYLQQSGPKKVICERYYDSGKVRFSGSVDRKTRTDPVPAAVISGHFIFTFGTWLVEVPYDELIYFDGEEDTLSARSWTNGWDIYYPPKNVIWHQYGRTGQKKHWDVHPQWWKIKRESEARVRQILGQEATTTDFGIFGLGSVRSYEDFQEFSGLYFPKWHLGIRARRGDVSLPETEPPPEETNTQRCTYMTEGSDFFQMGPTSWEERPKKGGHWWTYSQKDSKKGEVILHNENRKMLLLLTKTEVSWANDQGKPKWNKLYNVNKITCTDV